MKSVISVFLFTPMVASAAYTLSNGNFSTNSTSGWTTTGTVNASSGAAVFSASSGISQDFSNTTVATAENYDFQLDFTFSVSAANQNQRFRIRDNNNSGDIITLRLNSGNGVQMFRGTAMSAPNNLWENALSFTIANNTTYHMRITGSDFDLSSRSYTIGLSSDGVSYTTSSSLVTFHSAASGSDFETLVFESGASTTMTVDNITVVPEPASALLGGLGLLALLRRRRA